MKKVLIVDDEFLIRFTLEEGLKDRGYETQSAETVKDALEKMKTFHPQVILLDNRLQDSLGIDEISTFRSADEEVQVILMTAYGSVAQAVEATKRGAYDYILKPFDIDEIDRIALIAPNVVLNIIHDYEVVEKKTVTLPDELIDIVKCNNPKCITNNEPMKTRFHVIDREKGTIKCHYCERKINKGDIIIK